MAIITPVTSKMTVTSGSVVEVYSCPSNKTNAYVTLTFFKEDTFSDSLVMIALTDKTDPNTLTTVDYFIDDLELIGTANNAELDKLIVGANERLYVKVVSGPDVNVRVSGVEENNTKILKAGKLAASKLTGTGQTQIFQNNFSNVAYITASVTIFNTQANNALVEMWITSNTTPATSDKVMKIEVPANDTAILSNIMLNPNEKIFVKSNQVDTEYFINGIVVSA